MSTVTGSTTGSKTLNCGPQANPLGKESQTRWLGQGRFSPHTGNSSPKRVADRFLRAAFLNIGDLIYYGKFKNAMGRITGFGKNEKGDPTVILQPVNKDGSAKKSQPKELVMLKVRKIEQKKEAFRVVARFIAAKGLGLGQTWENGKVRIHRYRGVFHIWDLTNAGKRGKKVRMLGADPGNLPTAEEEKWMEDQSKQLVLKAAGGYDALKRHLMDIGADVSERMERGVDVRPGNVREIKLEWNADKDKLRLTATPAEFLLNSSRPIRHPKTGTPIGYQDTLYYPKGKRDAVAFYSWLATEGGEAQIKKMDINEIRRVWDKLKVKYDYH